MRNHGSRGRAPSIQGRCTVGPNVLLTLRREEEHHAERDEYGCGFRAPYFNVRRIMSALVRYASNALCGFRGLADGTRSVPATLAIALSLAAFNLARAAENATPLPTFDEVCFQARPAGSYLPLTDAQRMLEAIGRDSRMILGDHERVRLKGLFRLRDWTSDCVVRLAMAEPGSPWRLHVWGEGHGATLLVTHAGAAYRITDEPAEATTQQGFRSNLASLLTSDNRRGFRLPPGPYQIRCQQGAVVVTKGDVRLLTVPLEAAAKKLYLEVPNESTLHDLALFRSGPAPEELSFDHRLILDGKPPAQLAWKETLPAGARFQKLPEGCVELAAENTDKVAMAAVTTAGPGLYEVIFQVDDATAGTGVALLDAKGEPLDGIEFARRGKEALAFGFGSPREQPSLGNFDFANRPVPLAGPGQWLRLVVAGGMSKCWVSGDGVHWGRVFDWRDRFGTWQSIALYAREANDRKHPENAARHIRLRSLQVRELSGLTAAATAELLAKADTAGAEYKTDPNESPAEWTARIAALAPAGCAPADWRFACTLRALSGRIRCEHAEALLSRAVSERIDSRVPFQAKIRFLQDAALLWRGWHDDARTQLQLWDRLGRQVLDAGTPAEFELYRQALMETALDDPPERSGPISWELARDATMMFYTGHREADLTRTEHLLTFWRANDGQVGGWPTGQQIDRLLQWLNVRPLKRTGRRRGGAIDMARAVDPPLNRAASNILSELQTALDGKQDADAARVLVACDPPHDEGLVPAPDDDQLFLSFQTVLRLLMLEHRGLREAMLRQIGPADQLKIEQALARGDAATIEALPVQYCGTPAAVLPCQWLGDRALAAADFVRAAAWYDEALRWALPAQQPELAARKRLVWAMLGSAQGRPPTQPVSLGGVKVSPETFEGWVRDQLSRPRVAAEVVSPSDALPVMAAREPVLFEPAAFGQLDDFAGRGFKGDELPYEYREVDWTWQHLAIEAGQDSLLVVQRARIAAFDLAGGNPRWAVRIGNGWSPSPARTLVAGRRIYVRVAAFGDRTGVGCLDSKTGQKLWLCDCGGTAVSDPLWCRGRLFVFTLGPAAGQSVSPLCLMEINPDSGELISRLPILEMALRDRLPGDCQVCWTGNRLVTLLAGNVISTDLQGRIDWLRQETTLPSAIDPNFVHQYCQPAIQSRGRLFIEQPGRCEIDCLAEDTGQRLWQRGIIGLQGIVDLPDERLLSRTARGLVAVSKTTGEVLWQREFPGMLAALARTSGGLILCARQAVIAGKPQIVFLWIDMTTGETRAHGSLPLDKNQPIYFGPMTSYGDRTWCCVGYGAANDSPTTPNPKRIIELRPGKPAVEGEGP